MKKCLILFLALMIISALFTGAASAGTWSNDDGTYSFIVLDDGTACLTYLTLTNREKTEITLPETVSDMDGNTYTVSKISEGFSFSDVAVITIPDTITLSATEKYIYMGSGAQEYRVSENHPTLEVIDGVLFNKAEKALIRYPAKKTDTEYDIPDGIEAVAPFAFKGADKLVTVSVPDSVTRMGCAPFCDSGIGKLIISDEHPTLALLDNALLFSKPEKAFICALLNVRECIIPEGTKMMYDYAFFRNRKIETVQLPSTLVNIPDFAFAMSTLKSIIIPEGIESIGEEAFSSNTLRELRLPNTLKHIGKNAFYEATIPVLDIPGSVEDIDEFAFCRNHFGQIILEEGVQAIGQKAFFKSAIKEITLPSSLKTIGEELFYNCQELETVTIRSRVDALPWHMFIACSSLKKVILPETLESIGNGAFEGCAALSDIVLPKNLKNIGSAAFEGCIGLKNLDFPEGLETIGLSSFTGCNGLTSLYIPDSVKEIGYKSFDDTGDLVLIIHKNSAAHAACEENGWKYQFIEENSGQKIDWLEPTPIVCPECGFEFPESEIQYNYCPMCGTKL